MSEWIKFEKATLEKPEIWAMADLLGTSKDDVIGKLLRVWCWFDSQSRDGNAGSVTGVTLLRFIDNLVGSQGFAATMKKEGWLTDTGMPNFEKHNGESAKKRALTSERQQKYRNAHVDASVTPDASLDKNRLDIKTTAGATHPVDKSTATSTPLPRAAAHSQAKAQAAIAASKRALEDMAPTPEWMQKFTRVQ